MNNTSAALINKKSEKEKFSDVLRFRRFASGGKTYEIALHRDGFVDLRQDDQALGRVHLVLCREPDHGYHVSFKKKLGPYPNLCYLPPMEASAFHTFCAELIDLVNEMPTYLVARLYPMCRGERVYLGDAIEILLVWHPSHTA
jgi:hypothetical protein